MLKKIIRIATVGLLFGSMGQLWAACPLNVINPEINPKPLDYQGLGDVTFVLFEDAGGDVPATDGFGDPTCEFNVDLNYVELKEHDTVNITRDVLDFFDVTYTFDDSDSANITNRLHFAQKALIGANYEVNTTIAVDVTKRSTNAQKYNGFQLNVIASASEGSEYTFTSSAMLIVNDDSNNSVNGTIGGIVIPNITVNDTLNGNPVILGTDVNITSVINTTPLVIDQTIGSVTVPVSTDDGIYMATYTICEINNTSNCESATISVIVENTVPTAVDDNETTLEDTALDINVTTNDLDADGDRLIVISASLTSLSNGTVAINTNGTVKYTPDANFYGTDTFTYRVSDENGGTDTATVTVIVTPVNDAPVAVDDTNTTEVNTNIILSLSDIVTPNDTDLDGDVLSISSVANPTHGTVLLNADGTVTFSPEDYYVGVGTFEYTISDGNAGTDTATVTIIIEAELPDYEVSFAISQGIFINNVGNFDMLLRITEVQHGLNTGDVVLSINKNNRMSLNFDSTLTNMGFRTLSNLDWLWIETESTYKLKYIGNSANYPLYTRMYIGLIGTFTPPSKAKGKFPLTVKLRNGSGDTNPINNKDSEVISYSNDN